jgi:flagellin
LQEQLFQISQQTFNGASLFANTTTRDGGTETLFKGSDQQDHTISIFTSDNGTDGTKISIHRASLISALTIETTTLNSSLFANKDNTNATTSATISSTAQHTVSFVSEDSTTVIDLDQISMKVFEQALSNIAFLRAQSGGSMSRLQFAAESIAAYETNMRAALGRIEDVDIAEESANLAKYSILTQASAAMVAQANSTNDVALMLLR